MAKPIQTVIQDAIAKADSSYFFENYTKQAKAVLDALEREGYKVMPADFPDDLWKKAADQMKTGRVRPEEHVKNVYQTVLKVIAGY